MIRLSRHPLTVPLGLLLGGGLMVWGIMTATVHQDEHQRIVGIHVMLISVLGACIVLALYRLMDSYMDRILLSGQSFDAARTATELRVERAERDAAEALGIARGIAGTAADMSLRIRLLEERGSPRPSTTPPPLPRGG